MSVNVDATLTGSPSPRRPPIGAATVGATERRVDGRRAVILVAAIAWSLVAAAEVTGVTRHLDHDAVLEGGLPAGAGLGLFLAGWLVMVGAMMVPTMPAIGLAAEGRARSPRGALVAFLGGFAVVWAAAGLAALASDSVVHRVVHGLPAVEAHPWLVTAGALGLAGTLQLLPSTRRSLAAARRLGTDPGERASSASSAFYAGQLHGRRSLRSDGPMMLVVFAAGGGLGWMAILTLLMLGERSASGSRLAVATGVALLAAAAVVALNQPWLPFAFGDVA